MTDARPITNSATHYRIEVLGPVDVEWLQDFCDPAGIILDETRQPDQVTVLDVHADQAGIVGLVRRLHGLGITIQRFQVIQAP